MVKIITVKLLCPICKTETLLKRGMLFIKGFKGNNCWRQRYSCKTCNKFFSEKQFSKIPIIRMWSKSLTIFVIKIINEERRFGTANKYDHRKDKRFYSAREIVKIVKRKFSRTIGKSKVGNLVKIYRQI